LNRLGAARRAGLAIVAIGGLMLAGCDSFVSPDTRVARAAKLLEQGAYSEATIELKNALQSTPQDARVQLLLARANFLSGDLDGSERALTASEASSSSADRALLQADILLVRGKAKELLQALDEGSLEFSPGIKPAVRARALGALDRCAEAIPLARAALAGLQDPGPARRTIANCYARRGEVGRGVRELGAAVKAQPSDAESWSELGRLQYLSGAKAAAGESWARAVALADGRMTFPSQATLLAAQADLQIERNDLAGLQATRERLLRIAPQARLTELVGARLSMMQGDLGGAVKALRQLVIVAPDLAAVHVQLASAYFAQNNFEQARREISWLAQRTPDATHDKAAQARLEAAAGVISDPGQFGLRSAEFQISLGQFDMARRALEKVDADAAARVNAQRTLARLELRAGDVEAASRRSAALSDQMPEDTSISQLRAEVLTAQRRFVEAADVLKRLMPVARDGNLALSLYQVRRLGGIENAMQPLEDWLAGHPRDARVRDAYAEALSVAGENRRAIREYESLLVESPNNAAVLNNLAWLYYLERDTRALAIARKAHGIAPQVVAVADTYGWLLVEAGAIDEGLAQLRPLDAVTGVTRPDIRLHFAAALARKGDGARAKELVAELIAEQPEFQYPSESKRLLAELQGGVT